VKQAISMSADEKGAEKVWQRPCTGVQDPDSTALAARHVFVFLFFFLFFFVFFCFFSFVLLLLFCFLFVFCFFYYFFVLFCFGQEWMPSVVYGGQMATQTSSSATEQGSAAGEGLPPTRHPFVSTNEVFGKKNDL
jgi:hypothetical protein